jgi:hypothetical protein
MSRILIMIAVSAFVVVAVARAGDGAITYYVQLIRGTDSEQPPQQGSKHVGAKLARQFNRAFKLKNYWEINQRTAEVKRGRSARLLLSNGREVEIDLRAQNKRTVAAFQNGILVDRTVVPVGEAMTLIGGNRDQQSVWFIVVRRDKPGE